eukprot:6540600-Alexandrium_andersonii.AAC.1
MLVIDLGDGAEFSQRSNHQGGGPVLVQAGLRAACHVIAENRVSVAELRGGEAVMEVLPMSR